MEPDPAGTGPETAVSASIRARWSSAAEQVFATGLNNPAAYQQATRLVGQVLGVLRGREAGFAPLLEAHEHPDQLLDRVVEGAPAGSISGLDPAQIVAAACAIRSQEVINELAAAHRRETLAAAGDADQWVVLDESGATDGDPFVPYQRLEAQPRTGLVIAVSTRPDEEFRGCVHAVELLGIDARNGRLTAAPTSSPPLDTSREATSATEREEEVARLKTALN